MQEELLEQLVENTLHKESFQVIVSEDTTRFTKKFNPPIQMKKNRPYEIALVNLETYYSIPNITNKNNSLGILLMEEWIGTPVADLGGV